MGERVRTSLRWLAAAAGGAAAALALTGLLAAVVYDDGGDHRRAGQPTKVRVARLPDRPARLSLVPRPSLVRAPADPKREPPKPAEPELPDGQIVETPRPEHDQVPRDARFRGRYDMAVEREQKARDHSRPSRSMGRVRVAEASKWQSPQSNSPDPTVLRKARPKARDETALVPAQDEIAPLRDLGASPRPQPAQTGSTSGSVVVRGEPNGLLLPATSPGNVLHNVQALSGQIGSSDYVADVDDEGDVNLLNTRKYRYYDFFQRIKERVAQEWEPGKVWRQRDPTGQRYGVKDRLTIVKVTLDTEGALKALRVSKECGLEFLDEEARRAFAAASPFPNPPVGLKNGHDEIEFQFGFMFEISSSRFRMRGWQ